MYILFIQSLRRFFSFKLRWKIYILIFNISKCKITFIKCGKNSLRYWISVCERERNRNWLNGETFRVIKVDSQLSMGIYSYLARLVTKRHCCNLKIWPKPSTKYSLVWSFYRNSRGINNILKIENQPLLLCNTRKHIFLPC